MNRQLLTDKTKKKSPVVKNYAFLWLKHNCSTIIHSRDKVNIDSDISRSALTIKEQISKQLMFYFAFYLSEVDVSFVSRESVSYAKFLSYFH